MNINANAVSYKSVTDFPKVDGYEPFFVAQVATTHPAATVITAYVGLDRSYIAVSAYGTQAVSNETIRLWIAYRKI